MTDSITPIDDVAYSFEDRLTQVLADGGQRSHRFSAQYGQLWQSLTHMATGGKMIRPRLLIHAHHALGGRDTAAAVDAACAMQLLHIAFVIHDDVIDNDAVRRGEANISGEFAAEAMARGAEVPDAHAWGEAASLLGGDLMLTLAQSLLARLDIDAAKRHAVLDIFDDTMAESAAGELSDVRLSLHLEDAQSQDVLTMVGQKTAVYSFQAPLLIAAVLAGADRSLSDELAAIARQIGVIYQLRDDVLGLFGDERETGKSNVSDLREGKETLLITFARSDPSWPEVRTLFGDRMLSNADGDRLRTVIEESGALVFVESMIAQRCKSLYRLISDSALPPELSRQLIQLTSDANTRIA